MKEWALLIVACVLAAAGTIAVATWGPRPHREPNWEATAAEGYARSIIETWNVTVEARQRTTWCGAWAVTPGMTANDDVWTQDKPVATARARNPVCAPGYVGTYPFETPTADPRQPTWDALGTVLASITPDRTWAACVSPAMIAHQRGQIGTPAALATLMACGALASTPQAGGG